MPMYRSSRWLHTPELDSWSLDARHIPCRNLRHPRPQIRWLAKQRHYPLAQEQHQHDCCQTNSLAEAQVHLWELSQTYNNIIIRKTKMRSPQIKLPA